MHALSRVISLVAFAPAEEIFHKGEKALKLYSIFKGLIGTEGGVLFSGKSFGHEMVLGNAERVRGISHRACSRVHILSRAIR